MGLKILLLSGGIESTALAYWLKPDQTLTVNYGQIAAEGEERAAAEIARELSIPHAISRIDARDLGQGTMVGQSGTNSEAAPEWWPFRNQLLATVAAMRFAGSGQGEIIVGTVASDAVHCDGRAEFVDAMDAVLSSQKPGFRYRAPALRMSTAELILKSGVSRSLLGWTFSCHVATPPCGECRGCLKHIEIMAKIDSE